MDTTDKESTTPAVPDVTGLTDERISAIARNHYGTSATEQETDFARAIEREVLATPKGAEPVALNALLTRIDDAFESYERHGAVCEFEGQPMIYASTLIEIIDLRGNLHAAGLAHPTEVAASDDDLQTIRDRDYNADMADKLAQGIAEHFGQDIGEHSSDNCPWLRALDILNTKPEFAPCAGTAAAPEKAVPDVLFDGKTVYDEVMANDPHTPRPTADNIADVLGAVVRLIRKDAGAVPPVPAPAERGYRADAIAMFKREIHNLKRQIEDYCQPVPAEQPSTSVPRVGGNTCNSPRFKEITGRIYGAAEKGMRDVFDIEVGEFCNYLAHVARQAQAAPEPRDLHAAIMGLPLPESFGEFNFNVDTEKWEEVSGEEAGTVLYSFDQWNKFRKAAAELVANAVLTLGSTPQADEELRTYRQALEIIGVRDCANPHEVAADALVETGFWDAEQPELIGAPQVERAAVPEGFALVPTDINSVVNMGWKYLDAAREASPLKSWAFSPDGFLAAISAAPSPSVAQEGEQMGSAQAAPQGWNTKLFNFIDSVVEVAFEGGDLDGGTIQEWAKTAGLLEARTMAAPCSEGQNCRCADGNDFPLTCYQKTYRRSAAPAQAAPANRPSHETIVREGGSLVCTACGTSGATAAEMRGALERIKAMTDADDIHSYRCDDREGCLDTVFSVASEAIKRTTSTNIEKGGA